MKRVTVQVRLEENLLAKAREAARESNLSLSRYLERLLMRGNR